MKEGLEATKSRTNGEKYWRGVMKGRRHNGEAKGGTLKVSRRGEQRGYWLEAGTKREKRYTEEGQSGMVMLREAMMTTGKMIRRE